MKLSVIVNTHNKYISLYFLLKSLLKQNLKDIEVIIINNSNKPNRLITWFINKSKFHVIVIKDKLSMGALKNKAVSIASGEFIIFLNDEDHIKTNALELMYNNAKDNDVEVVITEGYKSILGFKIKESFSIKKCNNVIYQDIFSRNKLFKRSVLLDNPFIDNAKWENISNMPVILSNYKYNITDNRLYTHRIYVIGYFKKLFSFDDSMLDIIKVLDYLKPNIQSRDFKNIAIMEILYRLENYFYSRNKDEYIKSKLKDYLYSIDNYWFDYEIIKIIMEKDIMFRYFINHAHL